jgi:hypothetical protein
MKISTDHRLELQSAKNLLENPGIAAKASDYLGTPIEKGLEMLPAEWNANIQVITQTAVTKAADAAIFTMEDTPGDESSDLTHKLGAAVSGAVGGFFGIASMPIELPISTTIMLRSIADIARSEGESINSPETKIACIEVFALGGRASSDENADTGYFAVRSALAKAVTDAAEYLTRSGIAQSGSPALVKFIAKVSQYFGIQVTQKAAAQAIPVIGSAGGATINTLFINHYQDMARGHFIVRRLERVYGDDLVRETYTALPTASSDSSQDQQRLLKESES